jgi:hypothetical protein
MQAAILLEATVARDKPRVLLVFPAHNHVDKEIMAMVIQAPLDNVTPQREISAPMDRAVKARNQAVAVIIR